MQLVRRLKTTLPPRSSIVVHTRGLYVKKKKLLHREIAVRQTRLGARRYIRYFAKYRCIHKAYMIVKLFMYVLPHVLRCIEFSSYYIFTHVLLL